jgi:glyoxylase-like metal-dependent hydrolase (beta-lactamase superfamily II)
MQRWICRTCAVQYAASEHPPPCCRICEDERQYVGWDGQQWTTIAGLREAGFRCELRELEPDLVGVGVVPELGIGQRALLVRTPAGNLLWDCVGFLDDAAVARVNELGGVAALSASHPHFYGAISEWSAAFGGAPIWLPSADRQWVTCPDPALAFYQGRHQPLPGVTLVQCGGHFPGSAVLHWPAGAGGLGALLTGDTVAVVSDRRYVSFMHSYPNLVPLPAGEVRRVVAALDGLQYDRIYGGWWGRDVAHGGREAVARSAERYLARLEA